MNLDTTINTQCPICRQRNQVTVDATDYITWHQGKSHIQHIFPYLSPSEREQLMTGICADCWRLTFPEVEP